MNQKLVQEKRLTLEEYEKIHENKLGPNESIMHNKKEFVLVDVQTSPELRGQRRYIFNE